MANKLTQEKIDTMWAAFLECQSNNHVSEKCQVSRQTVRRYREREKWDERLKGIQERTRRKSDETIADRRARSKKILAAAIAQIGKKIAEEKLKYTAGDLERLVRLQEWFDGLPDRTEGEPLPEKATDILAEIIRRLESGEISERTASTVGMLCGHLLKAREMEEMEGRLAELERKAKDIQGQRNGLGRG